MMRIKTYKSDSVSKALAEIKKDLGTGAVILNTKRTEKKRVLGLVSSISYEITAADPGGEDGAARANRLELRELEPAAVKPETYEVGIERGQEASSLKERSGGIEHGLWSRRFEQLSSEVAELKHQLKDSGRPLSAMLQYQVLSEPFQRLLWQEGLEEFDSERAALVSSQFQRLVNLGLDENVAFFLNRSAALALPAGNESEPQLRARLNKAITEMISVAPLGSDAGRVGRVSVFIGPTGVGKTTTIAKLAARFALKEQKRVRLLTLDTYRIAAAEQLKTYGEIIGVPVRVVFSMEELDDVVSNSRQGDFLLIDSTGHSHKKVSEYTRLARYLAGSRRIQKHLVLSTATNPNDLREMIDSFEVFRPDSLVFTKLDESSSHGVIVNELVRTKKPLSCLTNGQNVPEDLIIPNKETIADMVVPIN